MTKVRVILAGITLAAAATAAQADITFTPTLTSDYDFRGYTQTGKDPALQLGVDASSGPVHVGAWGSNVNFGSGSHTELDFVADYTFGSDDSFLKANTGLVYYTYPAATSSGYPEIWLSLSKGWFSVAEHYSWDWAGYGVDANYIEANAAIPLGDTGLGVTGHVGYSSGQYWSYVDGKYTDYGVGLTYGFKGFNFALKWVDSDADYDHSTDYNAAGSRIMASVSTTLPWAKE